MHGLVQGSRRIALYLAAWLPAAGVLALAHGWLTGAPAHEAVLVAVPMTVNFALLALAARYPVRALSLSRMDPTQIAVSHVIAALVAGGFVVAIGQVAAFLLERLGLSPGALARYAGSAPLLFAAGALLYLLVVALHYLMVAAAESREAERRALELRALAREAELRALRAQIDPHFLFNSLNSVSALIASDPVAARAACLRLSDFLRDTLRLGSRDSVTLEEELRLVRSFLAVEQVRFGARLRFEESVDDGAGACPVPPLLLQPLVENAVRHGISHLLEGGEVRLSAARRAGRLALAVENPCDPERPRPRGGGLGLANTRARLQVLYGAGARLEVTESPERFRAEITLPAPDGAAQAPRP